MGEIKVQHNKPKIVKNSDMYNIYGRLFGYLLGFNKLIGGMILMITSSKQFSSNSEVSQLNYLKDILTPDFLNSQTHGLTLMTIWIGEESFFIGIILVACMLFFQSKEASFVAFSIATMSISDIFIRTFFIPNNIYIGSNIVFINLVSIIWALIGFISSFLLLRSHIKKYKASYVIKDKNTASN